MALRGSLAQRILYSSMVGALNGCVSVLPENGMMMIMIMMMMMKVEGWASWSWFRDFVEHFFFDALLSLFWPVVSSLVWLKASGQAAIPKETDEA